MKHLEMADLVELMLVDDERSAKHLHVSSCETCTRKLAEVREVIAKQRAEHRSELGAKDATFWSRQRIAASRSVSRHRNGQLAARVAAAAALVAVISGGAYFSSNIANAPEVAVPVQADLAASETTPEDPWQSDQLSDYGALVDWESWAAEEKRGRKDS